MNKNPEEWYHSHLNDNIKNYTQTSRHIRLISFARLSIFLFIIYIAYELWTSPTLVEWILMGMSLIVFLYLIVKHTHLFNRQRYLQAERNVFEAELRSLHLELDDFDAGKGYYDGNHPYSNDLDLFGDFSLYRLIGRNVTCAGKDLLAQKLQYHLTDKKEIDDVQQAVTEISAQPDLLFRFRTEGLLIDDSPQDHSSLIAWSANNHLSLHWFWHFVRILIPTINILIIVGAIIRVVDFSALLYSMTFGTLFSTLLVKKSVMIQGEFNNKSQLLRKYARLISIAQSHHWQSAHIQQLMEQFTSTDKNAIAALSQLEKQLKRLELINNQLLYFILEGSCFFQAHALTSIFKWKAQFGQSIPVWLNALAEFDVLVSYGIYAMNHPENHFPKIKDGNFILEAHNMGHPMMPADKCVRNSILIQGTPYFHIITGANMAGKSTYLRTVGINFLMACMGLPVCAESMHIKPVHLFTSLRTTDSLNKNESYFFAELKRLQQIILKLQAGEKMFIILDEILKGTNSVDKQQGSLLLMKHLISLHSNGIIATHDLLLGTLKEQFPQYISNYRFEAIINDNELVFDYKIQEGVAQNMNASFLMRKMGIIG